jgi:hypothetical protein
MMMKVVLGTLLSAGLTLSAQAAMMTPSLEKNSSVTLIANGCGRGLYRAANGTCHPDGYTRICPPGSHWGWHSQRCWPNN